MASFFSSSTGALVIITRTVWLRSDGTSLPRATTRILPSCSAWTPKGGDAQPTSTWPDITWVKVEGGLPVATGVAWMPRVFIRPSTVTLVDDPLVEKAMLCPAASAIALIGESAGTYQ